MVAIVDSDNSLNLKELAIGLRKNLPTYACPLFIRVLENMPLTGTFKLKKVELQQEGIDITKIKDKLYFYDAKSSDFVPLSEQIHNDIIDGKIRL